MSKGNNRKGLREEMKIKPCAQHQKERVLERDLKVLRAQVINNKECQGSVSLHL